ncbi:MAG: hypothetical protein ACPGVN_09165, partial [Alphaproteobacteria bacterium]
SALSCVRPNFASTFNNLDEAPETYWVGYGHLHKTGRVVEITPPNFPTDLGVNDPAAINFPKPKIYDAEYHGGFLDGNTLVLNRTYKVKVEATCLGPWCGNFPAEDTPMLLMMQQGPEGMTLKMGPCPGPVQQGPTKAQIEAIQACLRFGTCRPSEQQAFEF